MWDATVYTNITIGYKWTVYRSGPEATVTAKKQWQRRAIQISKDQFYLSMQLWMPDECFPTIADDYIGMGNEDEAIRWVATGRVSN